MDFVHSVSAFLGVSDNTTVLALLALAAAALIVFRPHPKAQLTFMELADLIEKVETFEVNRHPTRKMTGADLSVQLIDANLSIIYNRRSDGPKGLEEIVDVNCLGKKGMIFALKNGGIRSLEHVGDVVWDGVPMTSQGNAALTRFMLCLHKHLEKI